MSAAAPRLIVLADKTVTPFCRELARLQAESPGGYAVTDAGYDAWERELFDPGSATRSAQDAALALLLSPRVLEQADFTARLQALLAQLDALQPARTVFFGLLAHDPRSASPLLNGPEQLGVAARCNQLLLAARAQRPWLHLVDQPGLHAVHGLAALHDHRFEASAQMYYSPAGQKRVAAAWHRMLAAQRRVPAKVLVLDLDNTLWRGILGEDGAMGIRMGADAAGWPHRRLQQDLLRLKAQGTVLAIASKNNADEALRVLAGHPDCLLRPADFAALEIHWQPKSESLRRISETLNLGLDSFVFLDDSEFERAEVQQALPQVRVLHYPAGEMAMAEALYHETAFDQLRITDDDRQRAASYAAEAQRHVLRTQAASPEAFFRSLALRLQLYTLQESHLPRVHQLLHKTNQFNLTAERLDEAAVRARCSDPRWLCLGLRVADRMGDSGFTGVLFVDRSDPRHWVVANFLLSCRIIGRTVEHAVVSDLAQRAAAAGTASLTFRFLANQRNAVARQFLERSGLQANARGDGWSLALPPPAPLPPHYVTISHTDTTP